MIRIENEKFVIEMNHFADGETLTRIQRALIVGLQAVSETDPGLLTLLSTHRDTLEIWPIFLCQY